MKSTFWTRLPITIVGIPAVIYVLNTGYDEKISESSSVKDVENFLNSRKH